MAKPAKPGLILHAGCPKSGTKSIQHALLTAEWRDQLHSSHIAPMSIPAQMRSELRGDPVVAKFRDLTGGDRDANIGFYFHAICGQPAWLSAAKQQRARECLERELTEQIDALPRGFRLLISAEAVGAIAFRADAIEEVKSVLSRFVSSISVLLYVREPLSYILSRMQQSLKAGYALEPSVQQAMSTCDATVAIRHLENAFHARNVEVRSFDRALLSNCDVVSDFMQSIAGISCACPSTENAAQRLNSGIPSEVLWPLVKMYAHKGVALRDVHPEFVKLLDKIGWVGSKFGLDQLPAASQRQIIAAAEGARMRICDRLGFNAFPSHRPHGTGHDLSNGHNVTEAHVANASILRNFMRDHMLAEPVQTAGPYNPCPETQLIRDLGRLYDAYRQA